MADEADPPPYPKLPRSLAYSDEDIAWVAQYIRDHGVELLQIPAVRAEMAARRLERVHPADIELFGGAVEAAQPKTLQKNLANLRAHQALDRPVLLVNALLGVEYVLSNAPRLDLLSIGPRSEAEIFALIAGRFQPERITGLDLISYSDFVRIGDMHAMPFDDDSFDVVVAGWVLTYSTDNQQAAREILRVARPGAHIAIGCAVIPNPDGIPEAAGTAVGGIPTPGEPMPLSRFYNSGQIERLFEDRIDSVIVRQEPHPAMRDTVANVTLVARLKA